MFGTPSVIRLKGSKKSLPKYLHNLNFTTWHIAATNLSVFYNSIMWQTNSEWCITGKRKEDNKWFSKMSGKCGLHFNSAPLSQHLWKKKKDAVTVILDGEASVKIYIMQILYQI